MLEVRSFARTADRLRPRVLRLMKAALVRVAHLADHRENGIWHPVNSVSAESPDEASAILRRVGIKAAMYLLICDTKIQYSAS